jgi:hypothetical protein
MADLWPGYEARGGEGQNGRVHVYAALPAGQGWPAGRTSRGLILTQRAPTSALTPQRVIIVCTHNKRNKRGSYIWGQTEPNLVSAGASSTG